VRCRGYPIGNGFLGACLGFIVFFPTKSSAQPSLQLPPKSDSPEAIENRAQTVQHEAELEWRVYAALRGTLLPHYIDPDSRQQVEEDLPLLKINGPQLRDAYSHVMLMDAATRNHDLATSNDEAKLAYDLLQGIKLTTQNTDQFNVISNDQDRAQNPSGGQQPSSSLDYSPPLAPQRPYSSVPAVFNPIPPEIDPGFRNALISAWQEIPAAQKDTLMQAGVRIVVPTTLTGEGGSDGLFDPNTNLVYVSPKSVDQAGPLSYSVKTKDPGGTLKHELGHALYASLHLDQWQSFQDVYKQESANMPQDQRELLSHFVGKDGASETFAELYAAAQGRTSSRISVLKAAFPKLNNMVQRTYK